MTDLYVDLYAEQGVNFDSSNIDILGYDRASKTLYVEFQKNGDVYSYEGVTESTYNMLVGADSVGSFYARYIKEAGYAGAKFDGGEYIVLREEAEDTAPSSKFSVGDRVMVKWDTGDHHYWDGPATVADIHADGVISVKPDHLNGRAGGFYDSHLTLIESGEEQGDRKWLSTDSDESPFGGKTLEDFLDNLVTPSKYGVTWRAEGIGSGPFEPTFSALSEADALAQFAAAIKDAFAGKIEAKIVKVTHYFD